MCVHPLLAAMKNVPESSWLPDTSLRQQITSCRVRKVIELHRRLQSTPRTAHLRSDVFVWSALFGSFASHSEPQGQEYNDDGALLASTRFLE